MPTFTSVKSGYWNDPTVWDQNAVPANGDSVVVAAGHTVIFNVDQSSFATGLAGLTINGTLKIPSKDEDSSMPDFVCLKVNANIAGSGSLLIGSQTNPIDYPQTATILINGSITTATVQIYGAPRSPFFDFPAAPIPANATSFQLQNGLPLRAGDIIAIGRGDYKGNPWTTYPPSDLFFTVQSYDPTTKTVTLTSAIANARPTNSLVVLFSRPVIIERYGSSTAQLLTGSGRYLQGCWLKQENFGGWGPTSSSSTAVNVVVSHAAIGNGSCWQVTPNCQDMVIRGRIPWYNTLNNNVSNIVMIASDEGLGYQISGTFQNVRIQNYNRAFPSHDGSYGFRVISAWVVGCDVVCFGGKSDLFQDLFVDYANVLATERPILKNVTCGANVSAIISDFGGRTSFLKIVNLTLLGNNTSIEYSCAGNAIYNLNGNLPTPPTQHFAHQNSFVKHLYFTEWQGFGSYPTARGRYFRHGRVVSDVLANPPAPNTFKFFLSETTNIQPIYLDWQVNGGGTIQVTGTITQLGTNESVKVQIFSVNKEPLLGDTPDYEQTYTAAGDINISWTPPSAGTWVVRVLAYPQQTTNPITIANLQVAGGGTGGGGGSPVVGEPAFVFAG
jgi:hypothetical protein